MTSTAAEFRRSARCLGSLTPIVEAARAVKRHFLLWPIRNFSLLRDIKPQY